MDSAAVREELVRTLALDLIGPDPGSSLDREVLSQPPSRWYLSGSLRSSSTAVTTSTARERAGVDWRI